MARRTRSRWLEGDDLDELIADLDGRVFRIQGDAEVIVTRMAQRVGLSMMAHIPRDTGRTARSVTWDASPHVDGGRVWAEAGPEWHVARYLEFGTARMAPRPFANQAATENAVVFIEQLAEAGELTQRRRTR